MIHQTILRRLDISFTQTNINQNKIGDYVRIADEPNIFSKAYTSDWNRELYKFIDVLRTQPPTCKVEDINDEVIEGNYHEQESLISQFNFESKRFIISWSVSRCN